MLTRIVAAALLVVACGNDASKQGVEEAQQQAAEEAARKKASAPPPGPKQQPPVPGRAKLKCENVIDAAAYTAALGEKEPLVLVQKSEPETAAACSLIRGGKRPKEAEQKALLKKNGKLGVLPGDPLCNISMFCWTIEEPERFLKQCAQDKDRVEETLGFKACVHIVPTGEADVKLFRFYDDDTRCVIKVSAGPGLVDNELIGKCAKTAHDLIGPTQIAVKV
jgi:hypothetical protein